MSNSKLPERASLEYLKKVAKDRLQEMRRTDPRAKLASALLAVAREHGFPSWRALKAEIEHRQIANAARFFETVSKGETEVVRDILVNDPNLASAADPNRPHPGWTALHSAAEHGHLEIVRLLLEHGANPNAREAGDNTYPLHWAAAKGHIEIVKALLDAGSDVHGFGDVHELDVIGWATVSRPADEPAGDVGSLLIERGARHHIFSAIAAGDLDLIQKLVEQNPEVLDRRMSRFEHGQTPLHFAISRKRYDILDLLIDLGADLEAEDKNGQTALAVAMLRADQEAMTRLHAAGAKTPPRVDTSDFKTRVAQIASTATRIVPGISVPDIAAALDWYTSIGFKEIDRYEDDGVVNFGMVAFGNAAVAFGMGGKTGQHDASLWFHIPRNQIDQLYQLFKSRQIETAQASLDGNPGQQAGIEFEEHIYDPFYGGRQFGIRDLNGYSLVFYARE